MVRIKTIQVDDKLTTQILKIENKNVSLTSPLRGISKQQYGLLKNLENKESYVIEVFQKLDQESIKNLSTYGLENDKFNKKLSQKMIKDHLNIFVVDITDRIPKGKLLENLLHILNFETLINDNLVCIPFSSSQLSSLETYENIYNNFSKDLTDIFDILKSFAKNEKNFVAYIPLYELSGHYLEKLFQDYIRKYNIDKFLFDFGGKHIEMMRSQISIILKLKKDLIEKERRDVFFYAFNISIGRLSKKKTEIPARDFLSIFVGFDCFGPSHKRYKLSKEISEKLKLEEKRKYKIFNRERYVYNVHSKEEAKRILLEEDLKKAEKRYNLRHQIEELDYVKSKIVEENSYYEQLKRKEDAYKIVSKVVESKNLLSFL